MSDVHAIAQIGFAKGTNELYDRARPSYQHSALAHIKNAIHSKHPLKIAELGSGTGLFTRALLSDPDWSSAVRELRAIEPSEGMRQTFAAKTSDPRVTVHEGTFDTTGIENGWADMVIIAQAFHWCPDYDKASAEFARILKPDGIVVFIWNLEDRNIPWVGQLRSRVQAHEIGTPQFRLMLWRQTFDTPSYKKFFVAPKETNFEYKLQGTKEVVIDRACSKSYIAILPDEDKAKLRADLGAIVDRGEELVWIDESKGIFEYPYKTYIVIAERQETA
ncbi:S-adenosyl-L-methionine-dependent methyltransferase [Fistulina hepatica ATCC 64428]|nr:S-adenosyl-L-methionine-dependent methyltransferase [Fistulina hepatica ATCC 64428]